MIQKQMRRFAYAFTGIWHALKTDFNYRWQILGGIVGLSVFLYFFSPITQTELFFLILSWTLILITELQNSSFETALDKIHPELHDDIGRSKDMAAGAVLTAAFFMIFVLIVIVFF